jgi:hypothetical protein
VFTRAIEASVTEGRSQLIEYCHLVPIPMLSLYWRYIVMGRPTVEPLHLRSQVVLFGY